VGLSEKGAIFKTPATPSKIHALVFKVALPKPIPLLLFAPSIHYTYITAT
jgi:hypothetical protein